MLFSVLARFYEHLDDERDKCIRKDRQSCNNQLEKGLLKNSITKIDGSAFRQSVRKKKLFDNNAGKVTTKYLGNLTLADVYFGHGESTLRKRKEIKDTTIKKRRMPHRQTAK